MNLPATRLSDAEVEARLQAAHPTYQPFPEPCMLWGPDMFCLTSHAEFIAFYQAIDTDFVYDQRSGLYLVQVDGSHIELMAELYRYHTGEELDDYAASDLFILRNLGIFKSRAEPVVLCGAGFDLPKELLPLQRDLRIVA